MFSEHSATFGCAQCSGDDARDAWENTKELERVSYLVDDSHFIVQVLRCKECAQPFLWVMTEIVDWSGGDDAQYRRVVPLTESEAETFLKSGEPSVAMIESLGGDRRYLRQDWPTGKKKPRVTWATGPLQLVPR
jgi:hypothetical protein